MLLPSQQYAPAQFVVVGLHSAFIRGNFNYTSGKNGLVQVPRLRGFDARCHLKMFVGDSPNAPDPRGAAVAWGSFSDVMNKTGWAVLDIHTVPGKSWVGWRENLQETRVSQWLPP